MFHIVSMMWRTREVQMGVTDQVNASFLIRVVIIVKPRPKYS